MLLSTTIEKPAPNNHNRGLDVHHPPGHVASHSEMQVHPDSCRESIYTEATSAERDMMFSG